jgi:hypothetical protein
MNFFQTSEAVFFGVQVNISCEGIRRCLVFSGFTRFFSGKFFPVWQFLWLGGGGVSKGIGVGGEEIGERQVFSWANFVFCTFFGLWFWVFALGGSGGMLCDC